MKIETKYNIGDTVWTVSENRIKSGIITQPTTFWPILNKDGIYDLTDCIGWRLDLVEWKGEKGIVFVCRTEKELASTKEELIKLMSIDVDEPVFE